MSFTLFFREDKPSCFEAPLFEDENELNYFIQTLLASGLNWYWMSVREYEAIEEYKAWDLPQLRHLTLLSEENKQTLYQDFLEEDTWTRRRTIMLFGIEKDQSISSVKDLRGKLIDFLKHEEAAIKCVIEQICDTHPQYIFVPNNPVDEMQSLLNYWGLKKDGIKTTKYKWLNLAQLEYVTDSGFIEMAFP